MILDSCRHRFSQVYNLIILVIASWISKNFGSKHSKKKKILVGKSSAYIPFLRGMRLIMIILTDLPYTLPNLNGIGFTQYTYNPRRV